MDQDESEEPIDPYAYSWWVLDTDYYHLVTFYSCWDYEEKVNYLGQNEREAKEWLKFQKYTKNEEMKVPHNPDEVNDFN